MVAAIAPNGSSSLICSGFVFVGVAWRCSAPLYLALCVCVVCGGGVSLYHCACGSVLYI